MFQAAAYKKKRLKDLYFGLKYKLFVIGAFGGV